jgi:hypothetical protein
MAKFDVTVQEAGMGDVTYTNVSAETKFDAMKSCIDDHRFIFVIDADVELTATARIVRS